MNAIATAMIVSVLYLAASCLVFVFGSSYFSLFRTNKSWLFKLSLVVGFGIVSWQVLQSRMDTTYGLLALAFLAGTVASVLGAAAGTWLPKPLRLKGTTLKGMSLLKAIEAVVVIGSIVTILAIADVPLHSIYLTTGNLGLGLGVGVAGFTLFAVLALLQAKSLNVSRESLKNLLPWIVLFVLANAFMEELWLRAIFLGPLVALVGPMVAIPLTAAVFALVHVGASYMSREERVRFLLILFPLGLTWGACMVFTGSIIASTLFHAGADLMIVNGFIAASQPKMNG